MADKGVKLKKQSLTQWIDMDNLEAWEGLAEKATAETVAAAVKEFRNVKVISVTLKTDQPDWPEVYHIVLEEMAPGNRPVTVNVWAPLVWNRRFLACVGGGTRTFHMYDVLGRQNRITMPLTAVKNGFATANTDGGVAGEVFAWGLDEETKEVDYELILNLAHRSTHSMTLIAKAVITALYGEPPRYSYVQGASGGGRQSLMEAQMYPEDYDGIWAVDPAINWSGLFIGILWPMLVMKEAGHVITPDKLEFFRTAAIKESGGTRDFIETADLPVFNPYRYVGAMAEDREVTYQDALVAEKLFEGPRTRDGRFLWYGYRPGTHFWSYGTLGDPGAVVYGETADGPEPQLGMLVNGFVGAWLERDMDWDWRAMSYEKFEDLFSASRRDFNCLECDNPDLSRLKRRGTKLLVSHAVNDDTIPCDGTVDYYQRVLDCMGSEESVADFMRLFMSPGGGHTDMKQPGLSFALADGMIALMKWVEDGEAPEIIPAVQYDFDRNAEILTGKVARYRIGRSNPGLDIRETGYYAEAVKPKDLSTRFHEESKIRDIMQDEQGKAILIKYIGALLDNPAMAQAEGMALGTLKGMIPMPEIKEKINSAIAELKALSRNTGDAVNNDTFGRH